MAQIPTDLYRSMMGNTIKKITDGINPGDAVLDPRWEESSRTLATGEVRIDQADVDYGPGRNGPEVQPGGGTSLHDVRKWYHAADFWIPKGTEYSDEIKLTKSKYPSTSRSTKVTGTHYQLEVRTAMTRETFAGYLKNLVRAAVAKQVELAKIGAK